MNKETRFIEAPPRSDGIPSVAITFDPFQGDTVVHSGCSLEELSTGLERIVRAIGKGGVTVRDGNT